MISSLGSSHITRWSRANADLARDASWNLSDVSFHVFHVSCVLCFEPVEVFLSRRKQEMRRMVQVDQSPALLASPLPCLAPQGLLDRNPQCTGHDDVLVPYPVAHHDRLLVLLLGPGYCLGRHGQGGDPFLLLAGV